MVATDAGQQLQEALTFLNDVSDQVLRALRNGLTFQDNFNCLVTESTLKHDTETQISTSGKRPSGVIPLRVLSTSSGIDGITWFLNNQGQLIVKIKFTDAPTESRKVQLLILFE